MIAVLHVLGIAPTVHTTGINWTSVGTIIGSVLTGFTAVLTALAKWINARVAEHREATAGQIANVAQALTGRLDSMDRNVTDVSVRVARLEGPVQRAAAAQTREAATP